MVPTNNCADEMDPNLIIGHGHNDKGREKSDKSIVETPGVEDGPTRVIIPIRGIYITVIVSHGASRLGDTTSSAMGAFHDITYLATGTDKSSKGYGLSVDPGAKPEHTESIENDETDHDVTEKRAGCGDTKTAHT